ncbi:MAG: class II aldolase/adducin family protein [Oscillospiraceae bacterium]|jgi:L-fuculose-phosphate aldolase
MPNMTQHPADEICAIMARIYDNDMTTMSGGNLSIRDGKGNIWISPSGGDKASLTHGDIIKVEPGGRIVGSGKPSVETPIHLGIMAARPDIKAILHAHPPALVALSLIHEVPKTRMIASLHAMAGECKTAPYGTPGSAELAKNVTEVFRTGCNIAMLENHGVFIGSVESLRHAYKVFEALNFGARTQINAGMLTEKPLKELTEEQLRAASAPFTLPEFTPGLRSGGELKAREEAARFTRRSYHKRLFTSSQGSFSVRIDENSFIITPDGADNALIKPEDFVLIRGARTEKNRLPHPDAGLHMAVYEEKPDINAVAVGCPPHLMTFAVTDAEFDVRLIPECCIRLRRSRKFPFGSGRAGDREIARYLQNNRPLAIIENDCVIVAANTAQNAYDCLEIAEYSAKSVHYAKRLGQDIKNITEEQIEELAIRFGLR